MQRGLDVHEFCNFFYENLIFTENTFAVNPNYLDDWLEKISPEAIDQIENFINFEYERWEICKNLMPAEPKKLFMPLIREGKYFSEKLQQVTIIDRLDLRPDGNYTLVEYKTEKYKPKGWKDTEFRRELMFQKTTLESCPEFQKEFNRDIIDFVVYFPNSNNIMNENYNWRTASALKRSLEKMREDIKNENYPCNVQYLCRYCFFNTTCEMEFYNK
jgi:hypothetical protein